MERVPRCEDCGGEVEPGVEPTQLFRVVEGSLQNRVWDATKQRWVRRKGKARAGGRRMRHYLLCRRCRGEALRQRAAKSPKVMENGKTRVMSTRERLEPKRGGRPRLLTDDELVQLHRLYEQAGLSMQELARQLATTREKGTESGYTQSILYGWRRLGLPLRPRGLQIAISRHGTDGTLTAAKRQPWGLRCRGTTRKGKQCRERARRGMLTCSFHSDQETSLFGSSPAAASAATG